MLNYRVTDPLGENDCLAPSPNGKINLLLARRTITLLTRRLRKCELEAEQREVKVPQLGAYQGSGTLSGKGVLSATMMVPNLTMVSVSVAVGVR